MALLKIRPKNGQRVTFTPHIQPICLPNSQVDIRSGHRCFISGWGKISEYELPAKLKWAEVPLMPHRLCRNLYKGLITDKMVCAGFQMGGVDTCQGDSGGPLACNYQGKVIH